MHGWACADWLLLLLLLRVPQHHWSSQPLHPGLRALVLQKQLLHACHPSLGLRLLLLPLRKVHRCPLHQRHLRPALSLLLLRQQTPAHACRPSSGLLPLTAPQHQ
jgi:hypothetical protein